jgi:3-phenylpropionate/trans-cinnamate dioxygenase ferredoxin reductase subunit
MTQGTVVIIGAGHAGFQVAASLRQHGYGERICLINDEAHLPYQRPPLSKAYLKGEGRPDSLMFRPDKFYRDQTIDLIADRAVAIDRAARRLLLASGTSLDYGHLVLATGARNRLTSPTPISKPCAICVSWMKARRCGSGSHPGNVSW